MAIKIERTSDFCIFFSACDEDKGLPSFNFSTLKDAVQLSKVKKTSMHHICFIYPSPCASLSHFFRLDIL
jgi:hypothetical protein